MEPSGVERKLAVLLAADVEGFTRLMRANEEATFKTLKTYRKIIFDLIDRHKGRVFGTAGDSVIAEFGSAVEAVRCAISVQEELRVRNAELPDDRQLRFRIGINIGDVMVEGDDLFGDGVNVAARLEGVAEPGGICISGDVYNQVRHKLSVSFDDIGAQEVKNIAEPVPAFRVAPGPVSVAETAKPAPTPAVAPRWRIPAIAAAVLVVVAVGAAAIWDAYLRPAPPPQVTAPEKAPSPRFPDKPSIAVLPFVNMSDDPEQEYFSDGITEDIITDLSKVSGLFIIARNSSFAYKGKSPDVVGVARELGVRYVLEGSVRKVADQVRINVQLIDGTDGEYLWAERYDGNLSNVFALQDEVTQKIVSALAVQLTADENAQVARRETNDIAAYDVFLQGWERYRQRTPADFAKAVRYFKRAVELDPQYGRAYAALAIIYWKSWLWTVMSPAQSLWPRWTQHLKIPIVYAPDRAQEYLQMALHNPTPLAHQVASEMRLQDGQHDEAIAEAGRAIALNPNNPAGYVAMAQALIFGGRAKEAVQLVEKAMRLDPHSAVNLYLLGLAHFSMGQMEKAVTLFERAVKRSPFNLSWRAPLAATYTQIGRKQEALAALADFGGGFFTVENVMDVWPFKDAKVAERFAVGLVKAGVCCEVNLARYLNDLRKAGLPEKPGPTTP